MDSSERELFQSSARNLLQTCAPEEVVPALVESGWLDLVEADPAAAVTLAAEEQGRLRSATPALGLVMCHAAGVVFQPGTALLLPPLAPIEVAGSTVDGKELAVDGVALMGHENVDWFLVPTETGIVSLPATSLERLPITGSDPELRLAITRGRVAGSSPKKVASPASVGRAIDAGRRWLASELIGLADAMLAETVTYVAARHQFGRPIGSFQAVKHRLADVHVAIAAARAGVETAWADSSRLSAIAAKCLGARAHQLASTHCHQVHGGIAFTVEHGFHRWIQRGFVLDSLLGTRRTLELTLGKALIAAQTLPRTPDLPELGSNSG